MVYCRNVKRTGERNPNMSQTIDTPSYTIELSDGSIRPMTVKELAIRLEQLMSADKGIAEMPVEGIGSGEGNRRSPSVPARRRFRVERKRKHQPCWRRPDWIQPFSMQV